MMLGNGGQKKEIKRKEIKQQQIKGKLLDFLVKENKTLDFRKN